MILFGNHGVHFKIDLDSQKALPDQLNYHGNRIDYTIIVLHEFTNSHVTLVIKYLRILSSKYL